MEENEIRIGCNFQLENGVLGGGIATIKNKYDLDVVFDLLEANLIKPIPLTEEWLLKFGFKRRRLGLLEAIKVSDSIGYHVYFSQIHLKEIEHVHQLQNLYFALTGEELTLKSE